MLVVWELPEFLRKDSLNSKMCSTIYHYSEVGSTNNIARKKICGKEDLGFVVISKIQTGGYGQRGSFWESPIGGLWCSIGLKPIFKISKIGMIPILTALGVANTLEAFNVKTRLKWPNDILYSPNNRKIGGILVEGKVSQHSLEYIIIGIGLNINNTVDQFSPPLRDQITTTYEILGDRLPLPVILESVLKQIENNLIRLQNNEEGKILSEWKKWDNIIGLNVKIVSNNIEYFGVAKDISKNGQLLLELQDGRTIKFSAGHLVLSF